MKQGVMIKYAGLYVIVEEIEYAALPIGQAHVVLILTDWRATSHCRTSDQCAAYRHDPSADDVLTGLPLGRYNEY